jgi:hypothetical protein
MKIIKFIGIIAVTFALQARAPAAPTTRKSDAGPATRKSAAGPASRPVNATAPKLTYKLGKGADDWEADKRERIVKSMDGAVAIYNENGEFEKSITATYNPGTPTADANYNGSIRFGGQIGLRTALHEIAHTLGIGQHPKWKDLIKDGKWTGEHALAQLREFDGPDAVLHADRQHFWPYGLNQDREGGEENFKRHVKMVHAFRRDLGIVK